MYLSKNISIFSISLFVKHAFTAFSSILRFNSRITFGNGGVYYDPILYTKIENQDGEVILEKRNTHHVAMSEDTATIMNHLLRTVVYGSNGTGGAAKSYISNMKIYAKTGTSNWGEEAAQFGKQYFYHEAT